MKLTFYTIVSLMISTFTYAQSVDKDGFTYLDPSNHIINKNDFYATYGKRKAMIVKNDSLKVFKAITNRFEQGKIENFEEIFSSLQIRTKQQLNKTAPLVIIFYPGKDPCNTSGSATKESLTMWYGDLDRIVYEISESKPLYIFKSYEGLQKFFGIKKWHKDPDGIVERTFFKYHYPCSSYVILTPSGHYWTYFGEFSRESVKRTLQEIYDQN